jgi:hypothetical protein
VYWEVKTAQATVMSLVPRDVEEPDSWWVNGLVFGPKKQLFAWRDGKSKVKPGTLAAEALNARRPVVRIGLTDALKGKYTALPLAENLAVRCCAIDLDGNRLALVGFPRSDEEVNEVQLYHLPSGKLACREQFKEDRKPVWVAFTPNKKRLVYATWKGDVQWWDILE